MCCACCSRHLHRCLLRLCGGLRRDLVRQPVLSLSQEHRRELRVHGHQDCPGGCFMLTSCASRHDSQQRQQSQNSGQGKRWLQPCMPEHCTALHDSNRLCPDGSHASSKCQVHLSAMSGIKISHTHCVAACTVSPSPQIPEQHLSTCRWSPPHQMGSPWTFSMSAPMLSWTSGARSMGCQT